MKNFTEMKNTDYFSIIEFNNCHVEQWDKFCLKSDDAWLWHTSHGILSKSFWFNHFNQSFCIIDKSNKNQIVAICPLFLIKRRKIIDYSVLDSLGGPAISSSISEKKINKITTLINEYLLYVLKKYKVNKCEFFLSSLSNSIIKNRRLIPNPLGPYLSIDKSSFTWLKNIKNLTNQQIFDTFSSNAKSIIKKNEKSLLFQEVNKDEGTKFLKIYYDLHQKTSSRKKINTHNFKYFEYIFLNIPQQYKNIFYVSTQEKILSISIFGVYKKNVIYWSNVSDSDGLKLGSNYFSMWNAIKYFNKQKVENIEFGEGFFQNEEKGKLFLNHFKKSFGGVKFPLYRGEKIISKSKDFFFNILRDIKNFKVR